MTDVQETGGPGAGARRFLKALASEPRQAMLMLFIGGELTVGEVATRLGIGQSTASQQLAILRDGGLVISRREGKTVYYRADPASALRALDELRDWVTGCCPPG